MKKNKLIILIAFIFIFTACSSFNKPDIEKGTTNIVRPETKLSVSGVWELTEIYDTFKKTVLEDADKEELFLSKSVIESDGNYTLNPKIESRYVNFNSYMSSNLAEVPDFFEYKLDNVTVIKFSNDLSYSQEFIKIEDNKLISLSLGKILVFEKKSDISQKEEDDKFLAVQAIIRGEDKQEDNDFGLAVSFRKRDSSEQEQINYDYYTYYMKKSKEDTKPYIMKTEDIVVPRSTGLWTVATTINKTDEGFNNFTLSANPTFIDKKEKINNISDNIFRRIDYVNPDFIAVTNFNYLSDSISQNYNIFNISKLSSKDPLKISNIAGTEGKDILLTRFNENLNILLNRADLELFPSNADLSNIGLKRRVNNWQFISNINLDSKSTGKKISTEYALKLSPIINIAGNENRDLAWREILSRRPGAIGATVSPDKKYILIQTKDSLEMYPIYFNFIGTTPLFIIQNVDEYEMVMINWVGKENIEPLYREYNKLYKLNSYIIYP